MGAWLELELTLTHLCMYMYTCHTHTHTHTHTLKHRLSHTGIVMSKTYGIAKKATATAVKVLNDEGSGKEK